MDQSENEEFPKTKFIRLKNGDDIISEVVEIYDEENLTFLLINPMKIVYIPASRGSNYLQIGFIPWVFRKICNEQQFSLSFEDILMTSDTSDAMNEYYWTSLEEFEIMQNRDSEVNEQNEELVEEDMDKLKEIMKALAETKRTYH